MNATKNPNIKYDLSVNFKFGQGQIGNANNLQDS